MASLPSDPPKVGSPVPTIRGFHVAQIIVASLRESALQRLFTTFADGWPGFGLLVQRLVTGVALLHEGILLLRETPTAASTTAQVLRALLAICIMTGLWTPLAGALIVAVETWIARLHPGGAGTATLIAALGGTLAMIGPGAFSIDARLFGRKHIRS